MMKALLVDDEQNNLDNLAFLLANDCEGISVAGMATSAGEAREWLKSNRPDVVFLDINMPGEDGFMLLSSLPNYQFQVVFVTAYDQYAIQAIRCSVMDYLLKPVNVDELRKTVGRLKSLAGLPSEHTRMLMEHLLSTVEHRKQVTKIALPQMGGIIFLEMNDIVSLQADSNYTIIHLKNMQKIVITKTLKEFEELLDPHNFCRIHKSYIVNLKYISEYSSTDGGTVKMEDGNEWSISRRQLDTFLEKMKSSSLVFPKQ